MGAVIALAITVWIANQARRDGEKRDSLQVQRQQDSLGVLLLLMRQAIGMATGALHAGGYDDERRALRTLDGLIRRAELAAIDLAGTHAAWQFLDGFRIAAECASLMRDRVTGAERMRSMAGDPAYSSSPLLSVHEAGVNTVIQNFEKAIGRSLS